MKYTAVMFFMLAAIGILIGAGVGALVQQATAVYP